MGKFKEYKDRNMYLLPPSVEDFVSEGHLSRVIEEIVEALDTEKIEEKYSYLGQKSYHPKIILKLLFYGYATGIRSGRKISQRCETDTAYMYLSRMQKPDFRTINDFRKDNLEIIEGYFKDIIIMCKELGMVRAGRIILDGTKIRASASSRRTKNKEGYEKWIKRIDKEIKDILKEANRTDETEDKLYGEENRGDELPKELQKRDKLKQKIKEVIKEMKEEEKVNLTDKDAKFMKERNGVIKPNYNSQVGVTEDGIIIEGYATNKVNDKEELKELIEGAEENVDEEIKEVVADSGYSSYDNYEYLKDKEKIVYIPDQNFHKKEEDKEDKYHKENFIYDKEKDIYICPEGKELYLYKTRDDKKRKKKQKIYRGKECVHCKERINCTKGKVREIHREQREELRDKVRERLETEEGKKIYKKRLSTVEPIFGNIKYNLKYLMFQMRGLKKVNGEFKFMCMVHNILKIYKYKSKLRYAT